ASKRRGPAKRRSRLSRRRSATRSSTRPVSGSARSRSRPSGSNARWRRATRRRWGWEPGGGRESFLQTAFFHKGSGIVLQGVAFPQGVGNRFLQMKTLETIPDPLWKTLCEKTATLAPDSLPQRGEHARDRPAAAAWLARRARADADLDGSRPGADSDSSAIRRRTAASVGAAARRARTIGQRRQRDPHARARSG